MNRSINNIKDVKYLIDKIAKAVNQLQSLIKIAFKQQNCDGLDLNRLIEEELQLKIDVSNCYSILVKFAYGDGAAPHIIQFNHILEVFIAELRSSSGLAPGCTLMLDIFLKEVYDIAIAKLEPL